MLIINGQEVSIPNDYTPVQTVSPTLGMPSDYQTVRANPGNFGAQIGQSLEKTGGILDQVGDKAMSSALEMQGLINETAANEAQIRNHVDNSAIYDELKTYRGRYASEYLPIAQQKVLDSFQQKREALKNPIAQRAFDSVARRELGFTLSDMHSYADSELHNAFRQAKDDTLKLDVQSAGAIEVAQDPGRWGSVLGHIKADVWDKLGPEGLGLLVPSAGGKLNRDGSVTFDLTKSEGKDAQAAFNAIYTEQVGLAAKAKYDTLLEKDPSQAWNEYQREKDTLPPTVSASVFRQLQPQYRAAQTAVIQKNITSTAHEDYLRSQSNINSNVTAVDLANVTISKESSWEYDNLGQFKSPEMIHKYFQNPADVNNREKNLAATIQAHEDLAKKYRMPNGNIDAERLAVAWCSGEGNVSRPGEPLPYKNGDYVIMRNKDGSVAETASEYVSDYMNRLSKTNPSYESEINFLRRNSSHYIDMGVKAADDSFGTDHPEYGQAVSSGLQSKFNAIIGQAEHAQMANKDLVQRALFGAFNKGAPLMTYDDFMNSPPQVVRAYNEASAIDPYLPMHVLRILQANSGGTQTSPGNLFIGHFNEIHEGKIQDILSLANELSYGKTARLTNTGYSLLKDELARVQDPKRQDLAKAEYTWLNRHDIRGSITGTGASPNAGIDGDGDEKFRGFLMNVLPKIAAGEKAGLTASQMFDETSPDYVGKDIKYFQRTFAEIIDSQMKGMMSPFQIYGGVDTPDFHVGDTSVFTKNFDENSIKTKQDLFNAMRNHQITPQQFRDIAVKKDFRPDSLVPEVH